MKAIDLRNTSNTINSCKKVFLCGTVPSKIVRHNENLNVNNNKKQTMKKKHKILFYGLYSIEGNIYQVTITE